MTTHAIEVRRAEHDELAAVVLLAEQQALRLRPANPHIRSVQSHQAHVELLQRQWRGRLLLVAVTAQGRVRGAVVPDVWTLSVHSLLHAYLTSRNGIASTLTLPHPHDEDAEAVTEALLGALTSFWSRRETTSDLIRWPSFDP